MEHVNRARASAQLRFSCACGEARWEWDDFFFFTTSTDSRHITSPLNDVMLLCAPEPGRARYIDN